MKKRVVVAMSGGVDSAVAALLLLKEGYDVIGVTMQLWGDDIDLLESTKQRGCCSIGAVNDAFHVAGNLGIPHYVVNLREQFEKTVIKNFREEYLAGRTPNPCVRCNEFIKFDLLLEKALSMGSAFLATGHYARIQASGGDRYQLLRGKDPAKDQSYVLHMLTQKQLAHILFPVGGFLKEEIRAIASAHKLIVAGKPDSQDICFVAGKDYTRVVQKEMPGGACTPGPIYDLYGSLLGMHSGLIHYTVGQRKKLGLNGHEPRYVVRIDIERNALVVGSEANLHQDILHAEKINWVSIPPPSSPISAFIKIRYKSSLVQGVIFPLGEPSQVMVKFDELPKSITPGQSVAFYDGEILLGGGTIKEQPVPVKEISQL